MLMMRVSRPRGERNSETLITSDGDPKIDSYRKICQILNFDYLDELSVVDTKI